MMQVPQDPFYILSIDGGGFRGVFAAHILKRMEDTWKVDWRDRFGLFAGTSTGSILAAGLATGVPAKALLSFYTQYGPSVFRRRVGSWVDVGHLFSSRYSSNTLKAALRDCLPDRTLGSIDTPLLIPSVDITNGCVHVLKSGYDSRFTRDTDVFLVDAVLSSCSAPTYFDPYVGVEPYQLADGGLWSNNPSLAAFIDARYRLDRTTDSIRILSLGTGTSRVFYPKTPASRFTRLWNGLQGWGFLTRWRNKRLLDLILNLQSESAHNMLSLLLKEDPLAPERILRLTFETDTTLELDNVHMQDDLISRADKQFTHYSAQIAEFLQLRG